MENLVLQEDDRGGWGCHPNESLQRLNLSWNSISDDDMPSIIMLLRQFTGLQELNLHKNNISDRGLALLAQDRVPSRLRVLQLERNKITRKSSKSIIDLLETHLELFDFKTGVQWTGVQRSRCFFSSENYSEDGNGARILYLMDVNWARRVLLRYEDGALPLPLAAWPIVLSRDNPLSKDLCLDSESHLCRENGIFFLLRHCSVLFESWQLGNDGKEEELSTAQVHTASLKRKYDEDNYLMGSEPAEIGSMTKMIT